MTCPFCRTRIPLDIWLFHRVIGIIAAAAVEQGPQEEEEPQQEEPQQEPDENEDVEIEDENGGVEDGDDNMVEPLQLWLNARPRRPRFRRRYIVGWLLPIRRFDGFHRGEVYPVFSRRPRAQPRRRLQRQHNQWNI